MGVKARWFDEGLPSYEDSDPFATQERLDITDVGQPIDLREEPKLNGRLIALIQIESEIFERGTTCPIKERPDTTCSACPLRRTDSTDPVKDLCDVGIEQEQVLTELAVVRERARGQEG